jgi:hypothetical protein
MSTANPLLDPIPGAIRKDVGGIQCDIVQAAEARVKRTIYWPGFAWETHLKPVVATELCMHAHVGMLVQGHIQVEFPDGCRQDLIAPAAVVLEPGHTGRVVGDEPAVLIEVDFEGDSARRFGMPETHRHH